jgi:hypothetical protein
VEEVKNEYKRNIEEVNKEAKNIKEKKLNEPFFVLPPLCYELIKRFSPRFSIMMMMIV